MAIVLEIDIRLFLILLILVERVLKYLRPISADTSIVGY